ncbi:MAG: dUTP diphosphatase [Clostridia bacterium]|nr:dUTP diphosphatase [Clostridia bacterium]
MRENVEVFVELCREDVQIPQYAREGDAGMDIRAAETVVIAPKKTVLIPTGLKVAIPDGYEIQVRPRSGLSLKTPLRVANSPGTIDAGYRDEVCIIMQNTSDDSEFTIEKGDRVAQFVLQRVPRICFTPVESVKDIGENRGGGFGSTGVG